MAVAALYAKRSTCERKQVGAVIAREGRILSTGYGGAPSGLPHCSRLVCDLSKPCTRTVHAEANAIAFAARYGIELLGTVLYTTLSPCLDCAKLIINSGISQVFFAEGYRDPEGIKMLIQGGVRISQLDSFPQITINPGMTVKPILL